MELTEPSRVSGSVLSPKDKQVSHVSCPEGTQPKEENLILIKFNLILIGIIDKHALKSTNTLKSQARLFSCIHSCLL